MSNSFRSTVRGRTRSTLRGLTPRKIRDRLSLTARARRLAKPRRLVRRARKRIVLQRDPWFDADDQCPDQAVFVLGAQRSGTTMLREILSRHSRLAGGPETHLLCDVQSPEDLAEFCGLDKNDVATMWREAPNAVRLLERFMRGYAEAQGKPRWVEKTPRNIRYLPRLMFQFPNAAFVHIIRDGRDASCSMRAFQRNEIRGGEVRPRPRLKMEPIREAGRLWASDVSCGLAMRDHPRLLEVRYEHLVADPEPTLRAVCEHIGEDFEPAMLEPSSGPAEPGRFLNNENAAKRVSGASLSRWRRDMTERERRDFAAVAGEMLIALGYERDDSWVHTSNSASQRAAEMAIR